MKSVRNLFANLIETHPDSSETELVALCAEQIRYDEDYAVAAAQYIVRNSLEARENQKKRTRQRSPAVVAATQQAITHAVQSVKEQIMLLNLEMPNGKRMRWCTGAEMGKFGGAYVRIAKKVGKTKTVGSVLDENQVREILK